MVSLSLQGKEEKLLEFDSVTWRFLSLIKELKDKPKRKRGEN